MKSERQNRIRELIAKYEIETQDEMMNRLREEGFAVTQATVSRDLKEMKLTKTLTARGTYRYSASPAGNHMSNHTKLNNAMMDSVISVEYSMVNVVIKTYPGMANAVASGIDSLNLHHILGCVAGDDAIIVVTRSEEDSVEICEKIRELMKTF